MHLGAHHKLFEYVAIHIIHRPGSYKSMAVCCSTDVLSECCWKHGAGLSQSERLIHVARNCSYAKDACVSCISPSRRFSCCFAFQGLRVQGQAQNCQLLRIRTARRKEKYH
jgi:hypothetical protein